MGETLAKERISRLEILDCACEQFRKIEGVKDLINNIKQNQDKVLAIPSILDQSHTISTTVIDMANSTKLASEEKLTPIEINRFASNLMAFVDIILSQCFDEINTKPKFNIVFIGDGITIELYLQTIEAAKSGLGDSIQNLLRFATGYFNKFLKQHCSQNQTGDSKQDIRYRVQSGFLDLFYEKMLLSVTNFDSLKKLHLSSQAKRILNPNTWLIDTTSETFYIDHGPEHLDGISDQVPNLDIIKSTNITAENGKTIFFASISYPKISKYINKLISESCGLKLSPYQKLIIESSFLHTLSKKIEDNLHTIKNDKNRSINAEQIYSFSNGEAYWMAFSAINNSELKLQFATFISEIVAQIITFDDHHINRAQKLAKSVKGCVDIIQAGPFYVEMHGPNTKVTTVNPNAIYSKKMLEKTLRSDS